MSIPTSSPTAAIANRPPEQPLLSDKEFGLFSRWLLETTGIALAPHKKPLVVSRLQRRLQTLGFRSYGDYFRHLMDKGSAEELQRATDLLTTNETYFFREPRHFDFLRDRIVPNRTPGVALRIWSAASSSGEEAYSAAMVLASSLGLQAPWEIIGTDISSRVLKNAQDATYRLDRATSLPPEMLTRFCLKGIGAHEGWFRIAPALRQRVQFRTANLVETLPEMGEFDLIFLRNVMIYFNNDTKRQVLDRVTRKLRPGGYLFISHSESLHGVYDGIRQIAPSIYQTVQPPAPPVTP